MSSTLIMGNVGPSEDSLTVAAEAEAERKRWRGAVQAAVETYDYNHEAIAKFLAGWLYQNRRAGNANDFLAALAGEE